MGVLAPEGVCGSLWHGHVQSYDEGCQTAFEATFQMTVK